MVGMGDNVGTFSLQKNYVNDQLDGLRIKDGAFNPHTRMAIYSAESVIYCYNYKKAELAKQQASAFLTQLNRGDFILDNPQVLQRIVRIYAPLRFSIRKVQQYEHKTAKSCCIKRVFNGTPVRFWLHRNGKIGILLKHFHDENVVVPTVQKFACRYKSKGRKKLEK